MNLAFNNNIIINLFRTTQLAKFIMDYMYTKVNILYSSWPAPEPKAVGCKLEQRSYRRYDMWKIMYAHPARYKTYHAECNEA